MKWVKMIAGLALLTFAVILLVAYPTENLHWSLMVAAAVAYYGLGVGGGLLLFWGFTTDFWSWGK